MKNFIYILGIATLLFIGCDSKKEETPSEKPNIVFIMSDDHAYQAISAYDNSLIETPNIDRIAKMGMLFTNASVTNSICAPSRAVILTGKHSHINGKVDNHFPFDTTNVTFPQILQKAGYQTAMFGKLHFGNNPKGFDQFKILPGQGDYYNPDFITKNEGEINVKGYVTDIITDMTLNWLKTERKQEDPFLLMYLHKAPHRAWLMAERHMKEFTNRTFPEPSTLFDNYEGRPAAAEAEMSILKHLSWTSDNKIYPETIDAMNAPELVIDEGRFENSVGRMDTKQLANFKAQYDKINADFKNNYPALNDEDKMRWRYQRYIQDYLGTIKSVDENVGRVLDYLEENNLMENTIIVYTSDQGFYLGEHGWFDKRFVYDESFKTPLLVSWPDKIKPGTTSDEMVQNLDFAQTFLDVAGVEQPSDMQGESLVPILTGKMENWDREAVYYHYYEYPAEHMVNRHYAIITKEYKLIHYYFDLDYWELIDRKKDPKELTNVYDDPAYADIQDKLHKELEAVRKKYGDSDELNNKYIDTFMGDVGDNGIFGVNKKKLNQIIEKRKSDKK
ncbi:sulfatase [Maribacter sp. ACAM166]|uniref:sulfatase family protein n=1 Tax=Maribacter sp. ACAM166 TaxID=2508996 RepID=UPI0010FEC38A|nr:sulfatase [Maribacter sp. ACAM166]TLP79253.1 sulfatase [Maribacter sp. ACAM166]